jgi:acetylornithine/N-succinyldiaminopimelate aminotransferase
VGAFLVKERANSLTLGDHGSTFGGNPLATAAGKAVVQTVIDEGIHEKVKKSGQRLVSQLTEIQRETPSITEIRGMGLLQAVEFDSDIGAEVMNACLDRGLLVNRVRPNTIRLMPPLIISNDDIDLGVSIISDSIKALAE